MHKHRMECRPPDLDDVDELSAHVFRALMDVTRSHFKLVFSAEAGPPMHPGQIMCLRVLKRNDGVAQRDLARLLSVAPPTVSKMLRVMEKSDLVERRPDPADQRLTRVHITETGRAREREIGQVVARHVSETIGAMSEDDRRELARLLEELGERVSQAALEQKDAER